MVDSVIILTIVALSALLRLWQELKATHAVEALRSLAQVRAVVLRDERGEEVPSEEIVPGDVALLVAGASIPADLLLLESRDLFVDRATLTGETFPVEKSPAVPPPDTPLARRSSALFMGTHVVSGKGRAVVVNTGTATEFGKIGERLRARSLELAFDRGVRRFGFFLIELTLLLVVAIFAINVFLQRDILQSFLFSLALAVGLTPELVKRQIYRGVAALRGRD